jgi:hypothetical protein
MFTFTTWESLVASLCLIAGMLTPVWIVLIVVWLRRCEMKREEQNIGQCRECGYSMAHLPEPRCPECGWPGEKNQHGG